MRSDIADFCSEWDLSDEGSIALAGLVERLSLRRGQTLAPAADSATQPTPNLHPLMGTLIPVALTQAPAQRETRAHVAHDPEAHAPAPSTGAAASERYQDLGRLGVGGMGEVRRVLDRDLNRTMAMKIMRADSLSEPGVLARFVEEAQCSAQLQHPGIVPVHELGRLPDGRVFFTMAEVRGRTLSEVIALVHATSGRGAAAAGAEGWTFRRLVDAVHRVCEAVAYAHSRGVLHRDLKPDNVMVGAYGEVLVVDWGLAKIQGRADPSADARTPVVTERSLDPAQRTRIGTVAGTPAFMAPEQARGDLDRIDARSDVYALGGILYQVLSGQPPFAGRDAMAVLDKVLAGPPEPLKGTGPGEAGLPLPDALVHACTRAMSREPGDRFATAGELAAEVLSWLNGAKRREQALGVVAQADALEPQTHALRQRAGLQRQQARALLGSVGSWQPETDKQEGWALAQDVPDWAGMQNRHPRGSEAEVLASTSGCGTRRPLSPTIPQGTRSQRWWGHSTLRSSGA